jgi:hypothetical protein
MGLFNPLKNPKVSGLTFTLGSGGIITYYKTKVKFYDKIRRR